MSDEEKNNLDMDGQDAPADEENAPKFKNITAEKEEEIDELFEFFDKDKDQKISFFELTNLLRWLAFNPTGREIEAYKTERDPHNSGNIDLDNTKQIIDKKMQEPDTIEELIEAMKVLDSNNSGTIMVPELRWAMATLGDAMEQQQVDEMIKEVDADNKGFVDILEFAKMTFNIKEPKVKS